MTDLQATPSTSPPAKPAATTTSTRGGSSHTSEDVARVRVVIRLHPSSKERAEYWAEKHGYPSVNEYMADAVDAAIRRENGDYDLPTLEIARLNQLVDEVKALSTNAANLERVVTSGFDSMLALTRGDNYLLDPEDGELNL